MTGIRHGMRLFKGRASGVGALLIELIYHKPRQLSSMKVADCRAGETGVCGGAGQVLHGPVAGLAQALCLPPSVELATGRVRGPFARYRLLPRASDSDSW